jgi:hypothetical protein
MIPLTVRKTPVESRIKNLRPDSNRLRLWRSGGVELSAK